jgi:hypothetical protein
VKQQIKRDAMDNIHEMKSYMKPKSSLVEPILKNYIEKAKLRELLHLLNNWRLVPLLELINLLFIGHLG